MLCTNWLNPDLFEGGSNSNNDSTFWLKFSCEWATMLIYILSLIAPLIFPNRNFD